MPPFYLFSERHVVALNIFNFLSLVMVSGELQEFFLEFKFLPLTCGQAVIFVVK